MEKISAEDDCVDSGAETAGSDYSPLSSTSSELSNGELQDPFLVCVHLIADPGKGHFLQDAADAVLAWLHPELQLFRVSERGSVTQQPQTKHHPNRSLSATCQPAMAVILFLQEAFGGKEHILKLHHALQRPPWQYHHTEKVSNGRRMLPLAPCSQDFFTLSPGTPLWAVRQVHYGKEIVRFTIYCRSENYVDMVRLYRLLLQRRVAQKKEDFCFFVVYSNPDMEIQLSFKRLPRGQNPVALESAIMEVRVRDVGALVPLLPHPCSPISEARWQTEDYDGNKVLLQIQGSYLHNQQNCCHASTIAESSSAPPTFTRSAASHRNRQHHHRKRSLRHQTPGSSHLLVCGEPDENEPWADEYHPNSWRGKWRGPWSGSLYSLPDLGSARSHSTSSSPGPSPSPHRGSRSLHRSFSLVPPFRLNVDTLIGAEETNVDTGDKVNPGSSVDLTVVSAYILPQSSWQSSAMPADMGPSPSPDIQEKAYKSATLRWTADSFSINTPSTLVGSHMQNTGVNTSGAPCLSDVSMDRCDSCKVSSVPAEEMDRTQEEGDQEFYI
ncbi:protein FAM124A isoform X2 [Antennarius striatus]|uniref:protein FAM124A isoform X2 n=1 Tax=Antennarius striatus TaxID=241820 RepID=UPI0035AFF9B5